MLKNSAVVIPTDEFVELYVLASELCNSGKELFRS